MDVTMNQQSNGSTNNSTTHADIQQPDQRRQTTSIPTSIPTSTFIPPHGLLKLPHSVASALATDFLKKKEIHDLGVTCRWMMGSLRDCWINEPISLPFALQRLARQQETTASTSLQDLRSEGGDSLSEPINAHIPHMSMGRFRNVAYILPQQSRMTETEVKLLSEVHRLVDCRTFTLRLSDTERVFLKDDVQEKCRLYVPIVLPAHLQTMLVHDLGDWICISDFVLPASLIRIDIGPHQHHLLSGCCCLSRVKWPAESSNLKELHGMHIVNTPLKEPLNLPIGLTTVSFRETMSLIPIGPVNFPNTITNLELPIWEDENGRYRDLIFPSSLKRLVFTGEIMKDDFDLTNWAHLPISCENVELKLRAFFSPFEQAPSSSPIMIIVPFFVKQLRVRRVAPGRGPLPTLDLSQATSLESFATDSFQQLEWPVPSSSVGIQSLKPTMSGKQFLAAGVVPSSIKLLDLTCVHSWNLDIDPRDYQRIHTLLPNLTHLIVPDNYKPELIDKDDPTRPMMPLFREVISELFYKYATTDNPSVATEPKRTMSKSDMRCYIFSCGAGESSASDDRITAIFTQYALPQGWTNYDEWTIEGFCEFYRQACIDRIDCVWSDLRVQGYCRRLIRDEFFGTLIAFSRALSHCTIAGRLVTHDPSPSPQPQSYLSNPSLPLVSKDDRFECYQYLNGVEVSRSYMTRMECDQLDQARFDCKPTE